MIRFAFIYVAPWLIALALTGGSDDRRSTLNYVYFGTGLFIVAVWADSIWRAP